MISTSIMKIKCVRKLKRYSLSIANISSLTNTIITTHTHKNSYFNEKLSINTFK